MNCTYSFLYNIVGILGFKTVETKRKNFQHPSFNCFIFFKIDCSWLKLSSLFCFSFSNHCLMREYVTHLLFIIGSIHDIP